MFSIVSLVENIRITEIFSNKKQSKTFLTLTLWHFASLPVTVIQNIYQSIVTIKFALQLGHAVFLISFKSDPKEIYDWIIWKRKPFLSNHLASPRGVTSSLYGGPCLTKFKFFFLHLHCQPHSKSYGITWFDNCINSWIVVDSAPTHPAAHHRILEGLILDEKVTLPAPLEIR
jgi:hypothetical protein